MLLKLPVVSKRGEKIGVLTLKIKALLSKKIVFVYCWFDIDRVKVDKIKLLIYQGSQYLIYYWFQSVWDDIYIWSLKITRPKPLRFS